MEMLIHIFWNIFIKYLKHIFRNVEYGTIPRSSMFSKKLSSVKKGDVISRGTVIRGDGQIDILSSGSEAESSSMIGRPFTNASSKGDTPDKSQRLRQIFLRPNHIQRLSPMPTREVASDNEVHGRLTLLQGIRQRVSADKEIKSSITGVSDAMSMSDSELGNHMPNLESAT